jgi:ABC-2 type transport system ATP-binding protein
MKTEQGKQEDSGSPVVVAHGLVKVFKDFWLRDRARAVDDISFEIHPGEVFGLLGPNGSGKSTTIKLMLGLLKKSRGRLAVFGRPPSDVAIKKRIGYLPEESYLYPYLNARETLEYYAKIFQLDAKSRVRRIDELLDMVGLTGVQTRQVREYSKGMQRRIGIAQALINDPEFLILDEPTTGLDPIGTRQIKDLIIELGQRGKTILLSSHLLSDVEDCVDRMVILYGGRIRAEGTCDSLLTAQSRSVIETDALSESEIEEIRGVLANHHHERVNISKPRQRLEELFLDIVEKARYEQAATSGAMAGGETASFLRSAPAAATDGAEYIDQLVAHSSEVHVETSPEPTREEVRQATPNPLEPGVIDTLLSSKDGAAASADTPARQKAPRQNDPKSKGQDEDVINSLLREKKGGSE